MYFRKVILYDSHTHCKNRLDNTSSKFVSVCNIIARTSTSLPLDSNLFYSVGIHPWYLESWEEKFDYLQSIAHQKNILAIGECGLDYCIDSDKQIQKEVFKKQIELSEKLKKPLVVHAVRSYADVLQIRKEIKLKQNWVLHAYNSSWQMAQDLQQFGCYFSFGKQVLNAPEKLKEVIRNLPLRRLLIESDEDSKLLLEIYNRIAELRKITLKELILIQKNNFQTFYNLDI